MTDLQQLCNDWNIDEPSQFGDIVNCYIQRTYCSTLQLAAAFEVIPATVSRWALGYSKPLPGMQRLVVDWIKEQVNNYENK